MIYKFCTDNYSISQKLSHPLALKPYVHQPNMCDFMYITMSVYFTQIFD